MSTTIPIEVSARHVHLDESAWRSLFGEQLIASARSISQVPQFVAEQRVKLIGPKGEMDNVGIVGPLRPYTQVELAATDARRLGITPPISDSGHLDGAAEITIVGPAGQLTVTAAIIQQRHVHASPDNAAQYGLKDRQEISITIESPRGGRFDHVLVRVNEKYSWQLHVDTDEANAFGITPLSHATIIA